jgi:hypothetical protein
VKKRYFSLLLVFVLLLSTSALAVSNSTGNFIRSKTYSGEFSDLSSDSTFYDNVSALYEYGLSVGKVDGTFGLRDSVTVGQTVIFAARILSLYRTGDAEAGAGAFRTDGMDAYLPYLLYLQSEGVLGAELDGLYFTAATRAEVAHVLANVLPSSALPATNADLVTEAYASRKFITDVTEYTEYSQDILTLYKCGISQGSNASGSYAPSSAITRGALAAMLTRMVDSSLRVTPDWDLSAASSAEGTTWGDLIFDAPAYIAAPATSGEIAGDVAYMLSTGSNTLELRYDGEISSVMARQVMQSALAAVKEFCEQCYNAVNCSYDLAGDSLSLTFSAASCTADQLTSYRAYTLSAAIGVHDALWSSGRITSDMTQYEKAKVYYDWICQNCAYDYSAGDSSISHIAYAVFKNGTAVCDGYTGAYNLLLKLEGIDCRALSNDEHIWTVATLDGTEYHIDTTWGDSSGAGTDYTYFGMSAQQSWNYHQW